MDEKNNNIPDVPDKKPNNLHLGEDFEIWLKGYKEQKNFLETKTHLDTQSQLADLRESFGQRSFETGHTSPPDRNISFVSHQNNSGESFEIIETRKKSDKDKNVLQGIGESIYVPFRAVKDVFVDAARIAFSPVQETKRTIAYLEQESSAKII